MDPFYTPSRKIPDFPKRILYIDDAVVEHLMVGAAFDAMPDVRVVCKETALEGIQSLPEFKPQLILLDMRMPGMDGPDTLKLIRNTSGFEKTPVIFLTAAEKLSMTAAYKTLGVIGVVHKPIRADRFVQEVHDLWTSHYVNKHRA